MSEPKKYSKEIAEAIKQFLEREKIKFEFSEHNENAIFNFAIALRGLIEYIDFAIRVGHDYYVVHTRTPFRLNPSDQNMKIEMALFMCNVNGLGGDGHFFFVERNGEILYKVFVNCSGGIVPTSELVKDSIDCPCAMFEQYSSDIVNIVFGKS